MPIPTSDWLPVSGPSRPTFHTLGSGACPAPCAGTPKEVMSRAEPPSARASFLSRLRIELPTLGRPAAWPLYGRGLETSNGRAHLKVRRLTAARAFSGDEVRLGSRRAL